MLASILLFLALLYPAQQQTPTQQQTAGPQATPSPSPSPSASPQKSPELPKPEEPPVVTKHEIRIGGQVLRYTATVGMMPIKNREGDIEARMFFTSYTVDNSGNSAQRPLLFSFNGGPGSASVWLHLGAIGLTRRVT